MQTPLKVGQAILPVAEHAGLLSYIGTLTFKSSQEC